MPKLHKMTVSTDLHKTCVHILQLDFEKQFVLLNIYFYLDVICN